MYLPKRQAFPHTARFADNGLATAGISLRYTAIALLGLATLTPHDQETVLSGRRASDLVGSLVTAARFSDDPGAVALVAWASAEVAGEPDSVCLDRMREMLAGGRPLMTVDTAWMLTAGVASGLDGAAGAVSRESMTLLAASQGPGGLFPHALPAASLGRLRAHVGCFADQVYPIQGLARYGKAADDSRALSLANACAGRIVSLQGLNGQWWWHYDARSDRVVEGFPVYSVHQHAMAPMALLDLAHGGGTAYPDAVDAGIRWVFDRPEVDVDLVDAGRGVIWRKVGRREPAKALRKGNAALSAVLASARVPAADRLFPATEVDRECRPYELGWLLYAWNRSVADQPVPTSELN